MPQMAPMWWTTLMTMTTLMSIMMNSILYFYSMEVNKMNPKTKKKLPMNWKW